MNCTISPVAAKPSGSVWGKENSGRFTDQLGNWNFSPSQRSLRQRSAMRCRSSTRWARPRCLSRWLITSPAWPPPMMSVCTCSTGMALNSTDGLAARGGSGRGVDDPAPECGEVALGGLKAAIDQIPAHALRHRQGKRRHQPPGGEVIVDVGPDAHRDTEPVGGGLQCVAVILKLRPARGDARDAGGLEP